MRRAIVVGVAIVVSIVAILVSRSLITSTKAGSPPPRASGPPRWRSYQSREVGFALRYPPAWFVTPLSQCETIGVVVANAPDPFNLKGRHPCGWPPQTFPSRGAAVVFYAFFGGGPGSVSTLPPDTPVPLGSDTLGPAQGLRRFGQVTFHHQTRYSVEVWAGGDASPHDRRESQLVLESIRQWQPPQPDPRFGECVEGWRRERVPTGSIQAGIGKVDAVSATDVWSVGRYLQTLPGNQSPAPDAPKGPPLISTPMVLHRLETSWQLIPAVDPTLKPFGPGFYYSQSRLADVAAISDDDVWVVGGDGRSGLIEHWDGRAWTVTPSPALNLFGGVLRGVSASGPKDVWAVGTVSGEGKEAPIVEHWDGKRWTVSPIPRFGRFTESYDVSAASTIDAWVVGEHWNRALALHWHGKEWRSVHTPWARSASLFGVVDLGPSNAWAVGSSVRDINGRKPWHAIVEHWDGERWTLVDLPPLPKNSRLWAISADGSKNIWTLGSGSNDDGTEKPIVLRFDGTRWELVPPPQLGPEPGGLGDIAAVPSGAWISGNEDPSAFYLPSRPFIASFCG